MTEDEFAQAIADMQAMGLVNRHLLAALYTEVLRNDPDADGKLRRISDRLVAFQDRGGNPLGNANMVRLTDSFIANQRVALGLAD